MALTDEQKHENRILKIKKRLDCLQIHNAINDVAKSFQKLVRLRSADRNGIVWCILCDNKARYDANKAAGMHGMDAGHFHGRNNKSVIFDEMNCHPCCASCNQHKSGNHQAYKTWMAYTYTKKELTALERRKNEPKKWTTRELAELKDEYLKAIARELKRIENGDPPSKAIYTLVDYENDDVVF
jgi:hypothetical protein